MISDDDCEHLRTALVGPRSRLFELDDRIDDENEDARESLFHAWRQFNALARIIEPKLVVAVDDDDELEAD